MVAARDWGKGGGGYRELMVKGDRVSVLQDEKLLEMDGGHGCTTMWVYLMPLNRTLRNTVLCVFYHNEKKLGGKKKKDKKEKIGNSGRFPELSFEGLSKPSCMRWVKVLCIPRWGIWSRLSNSTVHGITWGAYRECRFLGPAASTVWGRAPKLLKLPAWFYKGGLQMIISETCDGF